MRPETSIDRPVYSIPQFCESHALSRATLYKLWSGGHGPTRSKIGRRTVITAEAAREWRESLTESSGDEGQAS